MWFPALTAAKIMSQSSRPKALTIRARVKTLNTRMTTAKETKKRFRIKTPGPRSAPMTGAIFACVLSCDQGEESTCVVV